MVATNDACVGDDTLQVTIGLEMVLLIRESAAALRQRSLAAR